MRTSFSRASSKEKENDGWLLSPLQRVKEDILLSGKNEQVAGKEEVVHNIQESHKEKGETNAKKPSEKPKFVRTDGKGDFSTNVASTKLSTGKPKKTTKVVLGTNKRTFTRTDY